MKLPLIIFGLFYTVYCKPSEDAYPDYVQDDNQDYDTYGEVEAPDERNPEEETPVIIHSKGKTFVKNVGETVELPCDISGSNYVRLWRKNGTVLLQSHMRMGASDNMQELPNGSLVISNLSKDDGGNYECAATISAKNNAKVTHHLELRTPPEVESLTVKDNVTVLRNGDTLKLTCKANGVPKPSISWHKGSERLGTEGETLYIENVKHHHAGEYKCLADNKVGSPAFSAIVVKVEFKPVVSIEQMSVSSDSGMDTELKCIVHSEPTAIVNWKKDGINIKASEHHQLINENHRHILIIKGLEEDDFGVYTCSASNSLGATRKNITLVKTPAIVEFIKPSGERKDVELKWKVQSKLPISGHELQYRKKGDSEWHMAKPELGDSEMGVYTVKYMLKGLEPGMYETRIRSQNGHGWSEYSEIAPFEGVYAKHGHHKSHKKGLRNGKATQTNTPLKSSEPTDPQENDTFTESPIRAKESTDGSSSLTPTMTSISVALTIILLIRPPTLRVL